MVGGHPVLGRTGQGVEGAVGDVVDVDQVTDLATAAVELQRQTERGLSGEPGRLAVAPNCEGSMPLGPSVP